MGSLSQQRTPVITVLNNYFPIRTITGCWPSWQIHMFSSLLQKLWKITGLDCLGWHSWNKYLYFGYGNYVLELWLGVGVPNTCSSHEYNTQKMLIRENMVFCSVVSSLFPVTEFYVPVSMLLVLIPWNGTGIVENEVFSTQSHFFLVRYKPLSCFTVSPNTHAAPTECMWIFL